MAWQLSVDGVPGKDRKPGNRSGRTSALDDMPILCLAVSLAALFVGCYPECWRYAYVKGNTQTTSMLSVHTFRTLQAHEVKTLVPEACSPLSALGQPDNEWGVC